MAQNLEFSATSGLTLTATAYAIGTYSGGTNAGSVTQQAGTNRYLAAFASNLTAGAYRLDYLVSGTCIGNEVYDVDGSGTYQPRSEANLNSVILPVYGTVSTSVEAGYITLKTNEAVTITIGLTDSDGDPVSTIGMTLEAVFESGTTEVVIADADITKAATGVSFTAPSTLNSSERLWNYALRKTTDEAVLIRGKLEVSYAPNN